MPPSKEDMDLAPMDALLDVGVWHCRPHSLAESTFESEDRLAGGVEHSEAASSATGSAQAVRVRLRLAFSLGGRHSSDSRLMCPMVSVSCLFKRACVSAARAVSGALYFWVARRPQAGARAGRCLHPHTAPRPLLGLARQGLSWALTCATATKTISCPESSARPATMPLAWHPPSPWDARSARGTTRCQCSVPPSTASPSATRPR